MTRKINRNISSFLLILVLAFSSLSIIAPALAPKNAKADSNIATWVMCNTDDGKLLYNAATTDLVPYSIRSKSTTAKTDDLDSFLNMLLSTSGFDFYKTNETILGRKVRPDLEKDEDNNANDNTATTNANASAPKVNPFDRFGMSGLSFSSYSGEWKYYETDGCADQEESSKTDFGIFYEGRKEPKASFNEIPQSNDPRVEQYNKGVFRAWMIAFNDLLINALFSITKIIVTLTITFIGYSFTDVSELIGLGSQNNGVVSIFNNLYNGFFQPFLVIIIMFTAVYIFYMGIIKRQIRQALITGLGQTLLCMLFAAVIAGNPSYWMSLPNKVATWGQSVVISALGQSSQGVNGLCGTNVGEMQSGKSSITINASEKTKINQMEKISKNMQSILGCRMWEEFLFKPWVRGQFGDEYKNLYAKGKPNGKLKNINDKWVHSAEVPLGGDYVEYNWALFQLSAQTEAHAQLSTDKGISTDSNSNQRQLVDGVSTDWWRIVDAFSNYDEKEVTKMPPGGSEEVKVTEQVNSNPLPQWETWTGSRPSDRYGVAALSILFGAIGSIGPLFFGLLTAIYGVGITLMMAISPLFFLMGCWAGYGDNLFKGWLSGLLSTIMKKIVASGLLLVSFAMTINFMNMIDSIGWFKAFVLLAILTFVLVKNRKMVFDMFANINLGGSLRPDLMLSRYKDKHAGKVKSAKDMATSAAIGAVEAKKVGMSALDGARIGAEENFRQSLRRSQLGRSAERTSMSMGASTLGKCSVCGTEIKKYGYVDDDNVSYCAACASDFGLETNLYKVKISDKATQRKMSKTPFTTRKRLKEINKQRLITRGLDKKELPTSKNASFKNLTTRNKQWLSYEKTHEMLGLTVDEYNNVEWKDDQVIDMMISNLIRVEKAFDEYDDKWKEYGEYAIAPSIPEPLEQYVSEVVLDEAWHAGRYDVVRNTYKQAWTNWYQDNSLSISNVSDEHTQLTKELLNEFDTKDVFERIKSTEEYKKIEEIENKGSRRNKEKASQNFIKLIKNTSNNENEELDEYEEESESNDEFVKEVNLQKRKHEKKEDEEE